MAVERVAGLYSIAAMEYLSLDWRAERSSAIPGNWGMARCSWSDFSVAIPLNLPAVTMIAPVLALAATVDVVA